MKHNIKSSIQGPWPVKGKVLVCVSPSPFSGNLVRMAGNMAETMKSDWYALHIEEIKSSDKTNEQDESQLAENLHLAEDLGAKIISISSRDTVGAIIKFAKENNISHIIIGKPLRNHFRAWVHGGDIVDKLIRRSWGVQIYVIQDKEPAKTAQTRIKREKYRTSLCPYLIGLLMMTAVTLFCWNTAPTNITDAAMLYLLPVLLTAFWWGRWPSYFVTVCTLFVYDFMFVPPVFSFSIGDINYIWIFIIFLLIGYISGGQTEKLRNEVKFAEKQGKEIRALYEFSKEMAALVDLNKIIEIAAVTASKTLERGVVIFLPDDNNEIKIAYKAGIDDNKSFFSEFGTALWTFEHGQPAGRSTATLPASDFFYLPLKTGNKIIGVLGLEMLDDITIEQKQLIQAWTMMVSIAAERVRLAEEASKTALTAESERLGTVLFNSISHELRTPLATISGSISVLTESDITLSQASKKELYESIKNNTLRMERIINNLLDTARLESGTMKIKNDWCDIQDIIGTALHRLEENLKDRSIALHISDNLPLIRGDCVLLEQVLVNLIDNAGKYSAADQTIEIKAELSYDKLVVSVADQGDNIPEADKTKIFDKFYRGSRVRTIPGTGLGLFICKAIIEAHKGKIWVSNLTGSGKRFVFVLPVEGRINAEFENIDN